MPKLKHTSQIFILALLTFFIGCKIQAQTTVTPTLELSAPGLADQDDMCTWVHPSDNSLSTIIASDKAANRLFVYNLDGSLVQSLQVPGQPGNIDIRYNFLLDNVLTDIVGYNDRSSNTLRFYSVDKTTRQLSFISGFSSGANYGFSLYKSPVDGKYYAFSSSESSIIRQYELFDDNGNIDGTFVRQMDNGSGETEGMVCDDEEGILFAGNEAAGIYKYDAEPNGSTSGSLIAATGSNGFSADVEGLTLYYLPDGEGYLIASSQGNNRFYVFDRKSPHSYIKYFTVSGVGATDGIDVSNLNFNGAFSEGIFLCHDGTGSPYVIRGCQWEDIDLTVNTSYWNPRHSPFSYTTNTFAVIGDYGTASSNNAENVAYMVKSWNPEYVITTGDNSYDNTPIDENIGQFYSKFILPYNGNYPPSSPDQNRFWVSLGNHDYDDGGGVNAIKNYFPYLETDTYYDKVIGDVHFFFLDSEEYNQYSGAQKTWFDNAVANSTARWRVAAFHHPPYTSGGGGHPANEHNMRAWPFDLNNFHLVLTGHVHNMEHLTVPGEQTNYIVQGAGGRSVLPFENSPSPATRVWGLDTEFGACKVIATSSNLTVEFWSTDGSTEVLEHSFSLTDPIVNTFQLSVSVGDGWNMVSTPGINPDGMSVTDWWADLTGEVFEFNPDSGYNAIATTTPTKGFWMKNVGSTVYNFPAIEIVAHSPTPAAQGWNMIGGYEDIVDVNSLTTNPPGQLVLPIYGYHPDAGYSTATDLVPGYGYWVKAAAACDVIIPDIILAKKQEEKVEIEYFKKEWGRIIITDAIGKKFTLFTATGEVDLDRYELPPLPPQGMFDIRYGSGRILEHLHNAEQTIEMTGIVHPVTVKVQNLTIWLQDETGMKLNVKVTQGEDVVISDATINKLMVTGELIPPLEYALEQNYPNPFNPSTTISFSLPEATEAKLTIYNTLGQKIAELVNTRLESGHYNYTWDGNNAATGIYIYELQTNMFNSVKKMLLIK